MLLELYFYLIAIRGAVKRLFTAFRTTIQGVKTDNLFTESESRE